MAYAGYSDLVNALDANIVAQLSSDTGTPAVGCNPIVQSALDRASSMVDAFARVGNIYLSTDLAALSAANDPLLTMLVVDLATEMLFQRRAMKITPAVEARVTQARELLAALRDGKAIFGAVAKAADAGLPEVAATPLWNLSWYNQVSTSAFFPPRKQTTYPGA